jgi:hypothetical protein
LLEKQAKKYRERGKNNLELNILDVCETLRLGANSEMSVDFIGKGNIWIKNTYNNDVIAIARYIINEAVQRTAPGQLSITGLDSDFSGIFAPFAALASGINKQLELLGNFKELEEYLDYLGQHIQAVQNVIQGRSDTLTEFRRNINRPVEGYKLVVLFLNFSVVEAAFLAKLSTLLQRGPAAGVSFLVIPANNKISGDRTPHNLDKNINFLSADGNKAVLLKSDGQPQSFATYNPPNIIDVIKNCEGFVERLKTSTLPVVHFDEVNNVSALWNETSENGLTFTVGKYGVNNVDITIGDEINQRHNALITGAVGQGKSNLISIIIHSLCQRYSPRELNLYLLDFKEGVSLKPFANIGQQEYLPHAKVVGLESDVDLGLAVLEHLYGEYLRRLKLFKERNVKNLKDFRTAYPNEEMPRILAIIDEFQLMFGDDMNFGQKIVDLLEKSVRLFRAAGIHFILASQSISGNIVLGNKRESIFSQVPIRIAHKNSVSESQNTLGNANNAAAYLRAREAIVNLDYGEVSQNHKTVIAWANEEILCPLRRTWWEKVNTTSQPPYVFESDKRISAGTAPTDAKKLKTTTVPIALIGEKISITGEKLAIPFPSESGRNIAIIGSPDAEVSNSDGIIQGIALSIAARQEQVRFLFCDFRGKEESIEVRQPAFVKALSTHGVSVENIQRSLFKDTVTKLMEFADSEQKVFVFALGMDRWEYEKDDYGTPPLKSFVDGAPEKGIHFIGWWIKPSKFKAHVSGFEGSDAFNTKIFLRVDEGSVRSLTSPFVKWEAAVNRALLSDEVEFSDEIVFIPYSPIQ